MFRKVRIMKSSDVLWLFSLLLFVNIVLANSTSDERFPYLNITPSSPAANEDSVVMHLFIDVAHNYCYVPEFSDISFSIEQNPITVYPPQFSVQVEFTEEPLEEGIVCPGIYDPVDYGPVFEFGTLEEGTYSVYEGDDSLGTFSVEPSLRQASQKTHPKPERAIVNYNKNTNSLNLNLVNSMGITVDFFCLNGQFIDRLSFSEDLIRGTHTLSLPEFTENRPYIVRVRSVDLDQSFSVNNVR